MRVNLVAMGMGNRDALTVGALRALEESELLIGAKRLLDACDDIAPGAERLCLTNANAIRDALAERANASDAENATNADTTDAGKGEHDDANMRTVRTASILVSGDIGFYSLAPHVRPLLSEYKVETFPGVSSLVYFCAKLGIPWQDVHCVSAHGRPLDAVGAVQSHAITFLLTGGTACAHNICRELAEHNLGDARVHVGEYLSYANERIVTGTALELAHETFDSLAVMLVENPHPLGRPHAVPALPDEAFSRGKVPMTKRDVRTLALARLRVNPASIVWDVGAGTGSVSVECALAAWEGRVFAVERNPEAVSLIRENSKKFNTCNLNIIEGLAPEALHGLPAPDCVFIGGSAGHLREILRCALDANPKARIVITAITLETVAEAVRCLDEFELEDTDITQVSVAAAHAAGGNHLMMGNNPVYLISGTGTKPVQDPARLESEAGKDKATDNTDKPQVQAKANTHA